MDIEAIYRGEEIKKLLKQRAPILMIDTLYKADNEEGVTGLTIAADNFFCSEGELTEPGLIEHIAQSASAFVSYNESIKNNNSGEALLGYIGEVKKFRICGSLPRVGSEVITTIQVQSVVGNITLFSAKAEVDGALVATCQMKLSV